MQSFILSKCESAGDSGKKQDPFNRKKDSSRTRDRKGKIQAQQTNIKALDNAF